MKGTTSSYSPKPSMRRSGFTLIELLVVIAIIAVLASMLLPVLSKAKQKGLGIHCLNNLHQLSLAWILYTGDFNDKLPPNGGINYIADSMTSPYINNGNWVHGIMGTQYGNYVSNTDPQLVKAGSLFPYSKNVAVYKCPADRKTYTQGSSQTPTTRSIAMNSWMNPINVYPNASTPGTVFRKYGSIVRPGPVNTWVFLDESPGSINDGFFVCDPFDGYETTWVDLPASYHNGSGGISFADGHGEIKKWRDPRVLALNSPTFSSALQTPPTDLIWLQQRSTVKK